MILVIGKCLHRLQVWNTNSTGHCLGCGMPKKYIDRYIDSSVLMGIGVELRNHVFVVIPRNSGAIIYPDHVTYFFIPAALLF